MSQRQSIIPTAYQNKLSLLETEIGIKLVKDTFEQNLAANLNLTRVSAPLFVTPQSGLNDDLNGVERPVEFDIPSAGCDVQIVHSLAKWKRMALRRYHMSPGEGLYTDMNAIRRDEDLDNLHSVYVDQWDWEKIITPEERNLTTLKQAVLKIMTALRQTQEKLQERFPQMESFLSDDVYFITAQELEDRYPELSPKQRENAVCKEHKTVFLMQIGGKLKSGAPHDGRAPDYDDWALNGDILIWYPVLQKAVEISSMGVRVDEKALDKQLREAGCEARRELPFHKELLNGELPLTMGGGIGQSRICMLLLEKAHIGEVQSSIWPEEMRKECADHQIVLL